MKRFVFLSLLIASSLIAACGGSPAPAPSNPTSIPLSLPPVTIAPTNAPAPTTAANTNPEPPSGDPFDVIKNATLAQLASKSFRATTNIESAAGSKSQIIIEYLAPDRVHVISETGEQIAIKGKGAWLKEGDKWEAAPPGIEATFFNALTPERIQETLKSIRVTSVKLTGPELLDGKPMFVYTYDSLVDLGNNSSIKSASKIWIGALDRRAYRLESVGDSATTAGATDKVTVTYKYDIPLTIEPPL